MTSPGGPSSSRTVRPIDLTVKAPDAGIRLDILVARDLPARLNRSLSKSAVRRIIMAGAVRASGRPLRRPGFLLPAGTHLVLTVNVARLDETGRRNAARAEIGAADVLYEDDDLIAVRKPSGLQVHPSADPSLDDLFSSVKRMLASRDLGRRGHRDHDPYLGIHQRLDVETSGCVLFTKSERANPGVADQFEKHRVEKIYHAITVRPVRPVTSAWVSNSRVARVGRGKQARVEAVPTGGLDAETAFTVLDSMPDALLLEACPKTGRTHQIRAHLAEAGAPILGDRRYGAPMALARCTVTRTMLHALRLTLQHPMTGTKLAIECSYPRDFQHAIETLRRAAPASSRQR